MCSQVDGRPEEEGRERPASVMKSGLTTGGRDSVGNTLVELAIECTY
jgi:hypothetical protein